MHKHHYFHDIYEINVPLGAVLNFLQRQMLFFIHRLHKNSMEKFDPVLSSAIGESKCHVCVHALIVLSPLKE